MTAFDDPAPIPTAIRLSVLREAMNLRLNARRRGRADRQVVARQREAQSHHTRFLGDPMMAGRGL